MKHSNAHFRRLKSAAERYTDFHWGGAEVHQMMIARSPKAPSSSLHISMPPGMFIFQFYISQTNYNFKVSCYNFQWSFTSQWTEVSQMEDPSLEVHLATPLLILKMQPKTGKDGQTKGLRRVLVGHVLGTGHWWAMYSLSQVINYHLSLSSPLWPRDHWCDILVTHV